MDYQLLLFDLDFTLLRSDKSISSYTLSVLKRCREKGILIGFSTSRGQSIPRSAGTDRQTTPKHPARKKENQNGPIKPPARFGIADAGARFPRLHRRWFHQVAHPHDPRRTGHVGPRPCADIRSKHESLERTGQTKCGTFSTQLHVPAFPTGTRRLEIANCDIKFGTESERSFEVAKCDIKLGRRPKAVHCVYRTWANILCSP